MRNFILLIALMCFSFLGNSQTASEQNTFDGITNAIKTSQAGELANYLASSIDCDILGDENVYSKAQATQIMKDFFAKYKSKSFTVLHKSGKGQVKYIIGTYITTAGDNFRMTLFVKQEESTFLVQQIRIEKGS